MVIWFQADFKWFKLVASFSLSVGSMCLRIMAPHPRMLSRRGSRRVSTERELAIHLGDTPTHDVRQFDWGSFYCVEIPAEIEAEIISQEEALMREVEFHEGNSLIPNLFWLQQLSLAWIIEEKNMLEAAAKSAVKEVWVGLMASCDELKILEDFLEDEEEFLKKVWHAESISLCGAEGGESSNPSIGT